MGPGVLGADAMALVMIPSVDRVGRYFPLVLTAALPGWAGPASAVPGALAAWYAAAERLALSTLRPDFARETLDAGLSEPALRETADLGLGGREGEPTTLWWVEGGGPPLRADGMPDPARFHERFLTAPAVAATRPEPRARLLLDVDCAASALKGTQSRQLTDAAAFGPGEQAMSLLSGIGAHPGLPGAVQHAAQTLSAIESPFSMNDLLAEAKGKLGTANALLRARGVPTGAVHAVSAATLLVQGGRHAVLWSGIVRAYLLRDGMLHRLTRDHVDARVATLVTRAVGAERSLALDSSIGEARAGDRFLLASPGLWGALPEAEIAATLAAAATARQAATHLTQDALIAGAPLDAAAVAVLLTTRGASPPAPSEVPT
jgi:type VI secretion system protein ImpM